MVWGFSGFGGGFGRLVGGNDSGDEAPARNAPAKKLTNADRHAAVMAEAAALGMLEEKTPEKPPEKPPEKVIREAPPPVAESRSPDGASPSTEEDTGRRKHKKKHKHKSKRHQSELPGEISAEGASEASPVHLEFASASWDGGFDAWASPPAASTGTAPAFDGFGWPQQEALPPLPPPATSPPASRRAPGPCSFSKASPAALDWAQPNGGFVRAARGSSGTPTPLARKIKADLSWALPPEGTSSRPARPAKAVDISWLTAPPKTARALRQLGESKSLQEAIRRDEQERQAAQTQRAVAEAAATAKQALVKAEEGARRRDEIVERLAKEIHELKEKLETVASVSPSQAGASAAPTPSSFPVLPASEGFPAFSAWQAADTAPAWPSQSPALVPRQRTRSLSTETPLPASVPQRQRTRSFSNEPPEKPPTAAPRRHRTRSSSKETGQRPPRMQAPRQRTRSFSNDAPPEMPPAPAQRQRTRSLSSEKPQTSAMLRQRSASIEATLRPSEPMPRQRTLSSSSGGFREQHQDWHIDEERMERYKTVFVRADLDGDGFVEMAQARQALQKASLSEDDMGKILTLADVDKDGRFTRGEFVCALHLAYLRSKQAIPLPQQLPPELQALVGAEFSWAAKPEEMAQYHETFQQLDSHGTGIIGAAEGRELFEMSGLPVAELSHIWQLCDMDRDGSLTFVEFACAMAIVARRRRGGPVPSEVPIALQRAAAEFAPSGPSEIELDGYRRHYRQLDPSQSGHADIAATKEFFEASGLPIAELSAIYAMADLDHDGQLSEPEFLCAMALVTRRKSGAAIPDALPSSVQQACFAAVGPETSVPETQATQGSWQATSEELERYRELFSQLRDAHGFVGAGDAREVLESSGLPLDDLAVIWDLADAGDDGQLDEGEFICAMVLAMRRRAGTRIPSALPPELAASSRPAGFDEDELLMYLDMFGKQVPQGGHMSADLAREILESSNLPTTDLSLIWRLSASSASGLSAPEFLAAMVLARQRRQGLALPSSLPSPLAASATAVSAAQGYPT